MDDFTGIPPRFRLEQVYPNPTSNRFVVEYYLDVPSLVSVEVYDVTGRRVAVLEERHVQPAGRGRVELDSSALAPGAYFFRLSALGGSVSRKIVIVR